MNKVISRETAAHYQWGSHCDSWVLAATAGLSVKQESMPPGTREELHFHRQAQQFFFILKGNAIFYLAGEKISLGPQQGLLVVPQSSHFIANDSAETIEFLVISQPATQDDRVDI